MQGYNIHPPKNCWFCNIGKKKGRSSKFQILFEILNMYKWCDLTNVKYFLHKFHPPWRKQMGVMLLGWLEKNCYFNFIHQMSTCNDIPCHSPFYWNMYSFVEYISIYMIFFQILKKSSYVMNQTKYEACHTP